MISFQINDVKSFMNDLFAAERFDDFPVIHVEIKTFCDFDISGRINPSFFKRSDESGSEKIPGDSPRPSGHIKWKKIKGLCYGMIKGERTPLRLKISLLCPDETAKKIILDSGARLNENDAVSLCLNFKYENDILTCTSGISLSAFSMDRLLEKHFDDQAFKYFSKMYGARIL